MDMPNTQPPTLGLEALAAKDARGLFVGELRFSLRCEPGQPRHRGPARPGAGGGVKVFMGASTGNLLVDDEASLERLFRDCPTLLLAHCEDTPRIREREAQWAAGYGDAIPPDAHP